MEKFNIKDLGEKALADFKTKGVGFYLSLVALLITIIQTIVYQFIDPTIFNVNVIITGWIGSILFIGFALFKKTSPLAPVTLMVVDFLSLMFFAQADGLIDYLSTAFFSGFSFEAIFKLPVPVWLSVLCFIVSFIVSSVAMYLSWNKKSKNIDSIEENSETVKEGN